MSIQVPISDALEGVLQESLPLIFDESVLNDYQISEKTLAQFVRVLRNNSRAFTASTKSRGEISFSKRKMWRQKGTGRARCGSAASPLWRKGGRIFGPRPGGRQLALNRRASVDVRRYIVGEALSKNRVFCLNVLDGDFGFSTKRALSYLNPIFQKFSPSRVVILLQDHDIDLARSFSNIAGISFGFYGAVDFLELAKASCVIFMKRDKDLFEGLAG